ncbi:hexose carrier protein HEX6 isoform X1 [Spinacia oleracea]|uniref:Hexose carrier protein HEX6 isoform X1 n=1 Tax=Spinacia oleracea TaxID=3562 RepID=A0A9R0I790_SPIOL|nr:hexose carrier protein HEX6-like isoform X1 [Spinacia oleracea]
MAGGIASDPNVQYNGKITGFVISSCIIAALGGAIFGYDIGVSGGVTSMDPFLRKFYPDVYTKMKEDTKISNYCKFDSELLTLFTSSLYFAGLFASLLASSMTKAFGRKLSILVGGLAVIVGSAVTGGALNVYMLVLGRVLLGIGVGFANQAIPMYLVEIAPSKYRGAFNNGFHFSLSFGILLASVVNYGTQKIKGDWGWRVSIAVTALPALVITLGSFFLPETPNSLIQNNDDQKAKLVLQRIRGTPNVEKELNDLLEANSTSKTTEHPLNLLLFRKKYRPQLVMAIAIPLFQQSTGINVVGSYAPLLFRTIGFGESASLLSSVVIGVVQIAADAFAIVTVDKFGRRSLFFWGGVVMLVPFLVVGSILLAKLGDHGSLSEGYSYIVLVLLCVYSAGFSFSWGPLGWLVPSEIFQLEIRSVAQGVTVALGFVFTFVLAQTLLSLLCRFKAGIFFFFFAGWILFMTGFVHLLLPETKNVPLEKIGLLWKEHWFWSRIIGENGKQNSDYPGLALELIWIRGEF